MNIFFWGGGRHHMHLFFIQLYIRYCGGACQQRDWPNHKRVCREKRRPFFFTASSSQFCDEPDRWYELLRTLRMGPSFHEYSKKNLLNSMCLEWNKSKVFFSFKVNWSVQYSSKSCHRQTVCSAALRNHKPSSIMFKILALSLVIPTHTKEQYYLLEFMS